MKKKTSLPRMPATTPTLRFTPTAWAKLLHLRDVGETEIGGFGISRREALLDVEDLVLIPQRTTAVSVEFDDLAVADFFEEQVALGRTPAEFARIWVHTHPGDCPRPSGTDEATFVRVFGNCDWAVMLILARGGAVYARLAWNVGPRGAIEIPVTINYARPFVGTDFPAWQAEYERCVHPYDFGISDFDFWPATRPPSFVRRISRDERSLLPQIQGFPFHDD